MSTELLVDDLSERYCENDIDENALARKINAKRYDEPLYVGVPKKIIIIASAPRSGSTLLLQGLQSLSLAAKSMEFFNPNQIDDFKLRWGNSISKDEYVNKLFMHRTTQQGFFMVKCHHQQFMEYSDIMMKYPCQFIRISRRNIIRQAISLYIVKITEQWHSIFEKNGRCVAYNDYSFDGILKQYISINADNEHWNAFFAKNGIRPIATVWYEALAAHYKEIIATVAMEITGMPFIHSQVPTPELEKLADDISEYFYQRFIEDTKARRIVKLQSAA